METQISSNVKVGVSLAGGEVVVEAKIGVVAFAEKAVEWVKAQRPGGVEDPIADGFLALVKQIAGEQPSEPKPE